MDAQDPNMQDYLPLSELESFISRVYGKPLSQLQIVPYFYTVTFAALAQNGVSTSPLSIAANADFIMLALAHRAQIGAAQTVSTKTAPYVRLLLSDSGSNENFSNAAIDLETFSSNDGKLRRLPYPRILSGRTSLSMQATNYAPTAETYTTLDVVLSGVLVREY